MYDFEIIKDPVLPDNPYLPYLSAVEAGVVSPDSLVAQDLREPLGVMLVNGQIPTEQAGLISIGGLVFACDHTSVIDFGKDKIFLGPSSKGDITTKGAIKDSGLLILTRPNGLLRVVGMAVNSNLNPWSHKPSRPFQGLTRNVSINLFGIGSSEYDPVDIDKDGTITAIKRGSVLKRRP